MRGKPLPMAEGFRLSGITPADAGKTSQPALRHAFSQDHPRGCGENQKAQNELQQWVGSPPRMRGKHVTLTIERKFHRITPADAGKTDEFILDKGVYQDHPRGCGENEGNKPLRTIAKGSPPRMRGKRIRIRCSERNIRITPADAGKTYIPALVVNQTQDHPRGCGENYCRHTVGKDSPGSPPRMRGKH